MANIEGKIQKAILDYLKYSENQGLAYVVRTSSGAIKTETGRYFKTGKPGCPDILMCYRGLFVGLEVKTKKGVQSNSQKEAQAQIEKADGHYFIVRNIDDVRSILRCLDKLVS